MRKMIQVKEETHKLVKEQALKSDMTMEKFIDYLVKKHIKESK